MRIELMFIFVVEVDRSSVLIREAGRLDSGVGCDCGLIKVKFPFEMGRYEYDIKY